MKNIKKKYFIPVVLFKLLVFLFSTRDDVKNELLISNFIGFHSVLDFSNEKQKN